MSPAGTQVLVVVLAATVVWLLGPPRAQAAEQELALSRDGRSWSSDLTLPAFDPPRRWVPGDRGRSSFYVRNGGGGPARLTVEIRAPAGSSPLLGRELSVEARVPGAEWERVRRNRAVVILPSAAEHRRTRVDLRVGFAWSAGNHTQDQRVDLHLLVRLTAEEASGHRSGSNPTGRGSVATLPGTGTAIPAQVVWWGVVLVGGGGALMIGARGRQDD